MPKYGVERDHAVSLSRVKARDNENNKTDLDLDSASGKTVAINNQQPTFLSRNKRKHHWHLTMPRNDRKLKRLEFYNVCD